MLSQDGSDAHRFASNSATPTPPPHLGTHNQIQPQIPGDMERGHNYSSHFDHHKMPAPSFMRPPTPQVHCPMQQQSPVGMGVPPNYSPYVTYHHMMDAGFIRPRPNSPPSPTSQQYEGSGSGTPCRHPHLPNHPPDTQAFSSSKSPNNTPSPKPSLYPQNPSSSKPPYTFSTLASQSPQPPLVPEITLLKSSPTGEDQVVTVWNKKFTEPLPLDGWTVKFFEKVSPPPGSLIVEFYEPWLLEGNNFSGVAVNWAESSLEMIALAPSSPLQDVDALLNFESSR